jgi:hypothetical protein
VSGPSDGSSRILLSERVSWQFSADRSQFVGSDGPSVSLPLTRARSPARKDIATDSDGQHTEGMPSDHDAADLSTRGPKNNADRAYRPNRLTSPNGQPGVRVPGLLRLQQQVGNRAVTQLINAATVTVARDAVATDERPATQATATFRTTTAPSITAAAGPDAAPSAPPIVTARPATPARALDDEKFNPSTRAHDLLRAINSEQHSFRLKSSGFRGQQEDIEAERREINFPAVVAALDGLTASQVQKVEEVYFEFEKKTTLRQDLFGLGQSGRKADLTPDQQARLQALMHGTKAEPNAGPALHRLEADAIELHELLSDDLNDARRERVMAIHRRPRSEIEAVDAFYNQHYNVGTIGADLNRRLEGLQRMRLAELRLGNVSQADACAIEDKRRRIEALNKQDESIASSLSSLSIDGTGGYGYLTEQRRKEKQELTGDIQSIIELNKREVLDDPDNTGRNAGEAVSERLGKILNQQDGEVGNTLGSELTRTLGKEDAAVITAMTDPWNVAGSSNLVQAAAAQLAADERADTTSAKRIMETLRSFRKLARHDLMAKAYDPAVPAEQKQAILREAENAVTRLAQRYIDEYRQAYNKIAAGQGRSYDQIVASADDADEELISNLSYGGGRTSDLGELAHAMAKKDVDAVKAILRRQPNWEKVFELIAGYNKLGEGHDLRKELFGSTYDGAAASAEQAQEGKPYVVGGGLVSGRDAAQVSEQLAKPTANELASGPAAEAKWITDAGLTEYSVTMAHRGVTGWGRELGDDPETQRLLERTRNDLAAMGKQFEAEQDPAKRERLLTEMRRLRATLTGDADAYEKDNERVLGEIQSALSFAVSIALAVAIPGAGAGLVAFLQTTALNVAANVASNFVIKMGDYGLDDFMADVLGGALGAGGAKFGEELMGRVAAAVFKPAAEATAEAAGKLGVQTALSKEVGSLAAASEKGAIKAEEFELKAAGREAAEAITHEAGEAGATAGVKAAGTEAAAAAGSVGGKAAAQLPKTVWETGARKVGGFWGEIYGPKVLTGDFGLTVDEVLKAFAATAAGKIAHRNPSGTAEEVAPRSGDEPARSGEEPSQEQQRPSDEQRRLQEEPGGPAPADGAVIPAAGGFPAGGEGRVGFFKPTKPSADALTPAARKQVEDRFAANDNTVRAANDNAVPSPEANEQVFKPTADGFVPVGEQPKFVGEQPKFPVFKGGATRAMAGASGEGDGGSRPVGEEPAQPRSTKDADADADSVGSDETTVEYIPMRLDEGKATTRTAHEKPAISDDAHTRKTMPYPAVDEHGRPAGKDVHDDRPVKRDTKDGQQVVVDKDQIVICQRCKDLKTDLGDELKNKRVKELSQRAEELAASGRRVESSKAAGAAHDLASQLHLERRRALAAMNRYAGRWGRNLSPKQAKAFAVIRTRLGSADLDVDAARAAYDVIRGRKKRLVKAEPVLVGEHSVKPKTAEAMVKIERARQELKDARAASVDMIKDEVQQRLGVTLTKVDDNSILDLHTKYPNKARAAHEIQSMYVGLRGLDHELRQHSEQLAMKAAIDYGKQLGARKLTPSDDAAPGTSGTLDAVFLKDGKPESLLVMEGKGGTSELGTRDIKGVDYEQGTPEYLYWMLKNDAQLHAADPTLLQRIADGKVVVEYHLIEATGGTDVAISKFDMVFDRKKIKP